jgi:hypothetical protein
VRADRSDDRDQQHERHRPSGYAVRARPDELVWATPWTAPTLWMWARRLSGQRVAEPLFGSVRHRVQSACGRSGDGLAPDLDRAPRSDAVGVRRCGCDAACAPLLERLTQMLDVSPPRTGLSLGH